MFFLIKHLLVLKKTFIEIFVKEEEILILKN